MACSSGATASLRQAEQRILELVGVDEQGNPLMQPFEHAASADDEDQ